MKKVTILVLVLLLIGVSISVFSWYDDRRFPYTETELKSKCQPHIPTDWELEYIDMQYLDQESEKEYTIVGVQQQISVKEYFNQIMIFEWQKKELHLVWKSDSFSGESYSLHYADSDNDGLKNINVVIKQQNDDEVSFLRIYNWNRANTSKVYPVDSSSLTSNAGFRFEDYDEDGDVEIIADHIIEKTPKYRYRYEYYLVNNGQLAYEGEYVSPEATLIQSSKYPAIDNVIQDFTSGVTSEVYYLTPEFSMVQVSNIDNPNKEANYLVIRKTDDLVEYLYALDQILNRCTVFSIEDLNDDGISEVIFYDRTVTPQFYIYSIASSEAKLVSPVDDNFNSLIWTTEQNFPIRVDDVNQDGTLEIVSEEYHNDKLVNRIWYWDEATQSVGSSKYAKYNVITCEYEFLD